MLARLPSSLPHAATALARGAAPPIQRLPSCARFNSSEAAPAPEAEAQANSDGQTDSAPKKRAIPLAESLGDISISKKWSQAKNRGPRRHPWEGGGDGQRQARPPRYNNGSRRDGQAQADPRPPRSRPAYAVSRPIAPRQWQEDAVPSEGETQEVKEIPTKPSPAHPKVQLGNIDDLFGSPAPLAPSKSPRTPSAPDVTPSQARVQLLLERTAGDYSRYVPRPFPDTNVTTLGPLKLAEFTLSYQRDVTPQARQNVLAVVKRFSVKGTQSATP
ncbi:hypothetical protein LXA43DRAFT_1093006 [Ganoderma leucocontextum]|nr:hypothetical protein LXA43DRAFT_1093006 [Ganoderma leucocontextum]